MKNILNLIDERINEKKEEGIRTQLIELGERGKALRSKIYGADGAYLDLSLEELEALRTEAESLVEEWKQFYALHEDSEAVMVNNRFTDESMVCNDYIMHANDFNL